MPLTGSLLVTLSAQLDLRASDSGQGQRAGVVNRKYATSVSIGRFENNALTGSADENIATLHVQLRLRRGRADADVAAVTAYGHRRGLGAGPDMEGMIGATDGKVRV